MTGLEPALIILGRKFFQWVNSPSKDDSSFDVEGDTLTDSQGVRMKLRCKPALPEGAIIGLQITSSSGALIKADDDEFRDGDGDFCVTRRSFDSTCTLYVPFAAIRHPSAGMYHLRVTALIMRGQNETPIFLGRCECELGLPQPRPWRKIEYIRPLLDLCMLVVRAEGRASARKVGFVKEAICGQFELRGDEIEHMREAMKFETEYALESLVHESQKRFVDLDADSLLSLLANIAKRDGVVTAAEVDLIRQAAMACGCVPDQWAEKAKSLGLRIDDHWSILGLAPGATLQQITAAFRRLVHQHHPDRFSGASEEVRQHASQRTVAITEAYQALKAQFSASV